MVPKLVAEDIPLLYSLLSDVFPGIKYSRAPMKELRSHLINVCKEMHLVHSDTGSQWMDKVRTVACWNVNCGTKLDSWSNILGLG